MKLQSKAEQKRKGLLFILFSRKEEDFCGERDFSSIPVDGKCRNASGPVEALQQ